MIKLKLSPRAALLVLAGLLAFGRAGLAQSTLPQTKLFTVFPPGGRAGATVELSITGADLDEADRIVFSHAGITSAQKKNGEQPVANTFVASIAASVPPGVYEARVVGRFGISNPRAFVVGALAEVNEVTTNNAFAGAMELAMNSTVNGRSDANNTDHYKFAVKKGQRVLVECAAQEIDSRMQAVLVLFDAEGRELDRARRGGVLDYTAPADLTLVAKVYDATFGGGGEYFYRLTVTTGPWIDFVFPPCGQPGTRTKFTLYGRNLPGSTPANLKSGDGKPLEKITVDVDVPADPAMRLRLASSALLRPGDATLDGFEYRVSTPQGISNPALITFATAPVVAEAEPNNKAAQAQKISLPAEIVGQLYPARDEDWFAFDAKKGDVFYVEVVSARLGLPTDPTAVVQRVTKNDKGEEIATDVLELNDQETNLSGSPDFNTATRDPAGRFEAKEDGVYRLVVRDIFNRTISDPRFVYRLAIRKEQPDFRLVAMPAAQMPVKKDTKSVDFGKPLLRRSETQPVRVIAFRRDNFGGDITVTAENLPAGVTASTAVIPGGKNTATVLLTASESAPAWTGPLKIVGKAKAGDTELVREARGGSPIWTVADMTTEAVSARLVRDVVLSVSGVEASPITVEPVENKPFENSVAAKMKIPLRVVRRGDFNESLALKAVGVPALDAMKEFTVDGKATNVTLEIDLTQYKVPPGEHTFYLQSQVKGKYRNNPEGAKKADEDAKAMEKSATELAAAAKKAAEALAAAAKSLAEAEAAAKAAGEKASPEVKAKVKAAADVKAAAQKASDAAVAKQKAAEAKRDMLKSKASEAAKVATPKDVLASVYSVPIRVKIVPAPVTLEVGAPAGPVSQGGKIEVSVKIARLFNYADPVDVVLNLPGGVKGLKTAKVTIPKDQTQAKLVLDAAVDATPGEHKLTIQAQLKLNNQNLTVDQPLALKVAAVEKPKK